MTRQRQVYPRDMVAHLWANASQDSARDPRGNIYFTGPTLYSYGSHYVLGRRITCADGTTATLLNARSYSVTTSRHQSLASRAVHGLRYAVDGLNGDDFHGRRWPRTLADRLIADAADAYASAAGTARRSRKRDDYMGRAANRLTVAGVLLAAFIAGTEGNPDAADKRAARGVLRRLHTAPGIVADGESWGDMDNASQRAAATARAVYFGRERMRERMEKDWRDARRWCDEAAGMADVERYINARRCLQDAKLHADNVAAIAKDAKLRKPAGFADFARRIAAELARVEPLAHAEDVKDLRGAALWNLRMAELAWAASAPLDARRRRRRIAQNVTRYARRHYALSELAKNIARADAIGEPDAVPAYVRERAAKLQQRENTRDAIRDARYRLDGVAGAFALACRTETEHDDDARNRARLWKGARDYAEQCAGLPAGLRRLPRVDPAEALFIHYAVKQMLDAGDFAALAEHAAERLEAARADYAAEDAAALQAWRDGGPLPSARWDDVPRLRVRNDVIETSHGARVPLTVAPILWRLCTAARNGSPRVFNGDAGPRIGHFRLNRVRADGSVVIGCHDIPWTELEHVAHVLGYTAAGAAALAG
jgi:hypothetical protein